MDPVPPFARRALEPRDVPAVLAIQEASPESARWKAGDYTCIDQKETNGWVVEDLKRPANVVGFVVSRQAADEIEILNLAVHPDYRRRGAAAQLLAGVMVPGIHSGAKKVFLEVRESNRAAICFYRRFKFIEAGRRRDYYTAPNEDALILSLNVSEEFRDSL